MSLKINCYNVDAASLHKTAALLAEKAYSQKKPTFIKCRNDESLSKLDTLIWTFGRLKFIPHGTSADAHPELQPILLSTDLSDIKRFEVVIFVDITPSDLINALMKLEEVNNLSMVLFINNTEEATNQATFIDLIGKSKLANIAEFDNFLQQPDGTWQKLS